MSTLKIGVPKLHCKRKSDLLGADEVFVIFIITSWKHAEMSTPAVEDARISKSFVSPLNSGFRRGTIKAIQLGTTNRNIEVELGDNNAFSVTFGLFEKDSGNLYNNLKDQLETLPEAKQASFRDFIAAIMNSIDDLSTIDVDAILMTAATWLWKEIRKDDSVGSDSFVGNITEPTNFGIREFQSLRGPGVEYHMQVELELV